MITTYDDKPDTSDATTPAADELEEKPADTGDDGHMCPAPTARRRIHRNLQEFLEDYDCM